VAHGKEAAMSIECGLTGGALRQCGRGGREVRGWIVLPVVVAAVIVVSLAYNSFPNDSAGKATANQAVVQIRKEMKGSADYPKRPGVDTPPLGVYRYVTHGGEGIKSLFFSSGHQYEGVSEVTLTATHCGLSERWQPLVQRWTENQLCLGSKRSRVAAVSEFHEFGGKAVLDSYRCVGGSAPDPSKLQPGMSWVSKCGSPSGTVTSRVVVIGLEKVGIAGRPIDAVQLRSSVVLKGNPEGNDIRDTWIRRSDGLLLRKIDNTRAHIRAAGGAHYDEHYEIDLISTKPQR
jgi:hypothetical protein